MTFAPLYEFFENLFGLYNNEFSIVFQTFYQAGGYNSMGWLLVLIPLVFLLFFYFLLKYPYGTFWHWLIYIGLISLIVGVTTFSTVQLDLANFLVDSNPAAKFTKGLVLAYAFLNAGLALIVSFIYSLILKRFSKVQMHLPF